MRSQPVAQSDAIRGESLNNAQPPPWESAGPSQEPGLAVSPDEKQSSSCLSFFFSSSSNLFGSRRIFVAKKFHKQKQPFKKNPPRSE